jgi:hypothetical protein
MEQLIVSRRCSGRPVRRIGCNGDNVAIERMCDFIETLIIIVIFDREKRQETCVEIADQVKSILSSRGLADQDIRVFVADREAEDWYLIDRERICSHYNVELDNIVYKGKGGLAKLLKPVVDYHETSIGVDIFDIVRKSVIAHSCDIFKALIETMNEIECNLGNDEHVI